MIDISEIKSRAGGNWKSILSALGIDGKYLTGRHCPCPACGGKDRFRYTDYHGNGDYICNQCGSGDGFSLLMAVYGYSFTESRDLVANYLGYDVNMPIKAPERASKPFLSKRQVITPKDNLKRLQGYLWGAKVITKDSPAGNYLSCRGLDWLKIHRGLRDVYYRGALEYWHFNNQQMCPFKVGEYAAMISKITKGGELVGLHITYLQNDKGTWTKAQITDPFTGKALPAKKMQSRFTGSISGGAVRLYAPQRGAVAVCEGIETALAVREYFQLPVWACLSAGNLKAFDLPRDIYTLYIIADNDSNNTGYQAMQKLAARAMNAGLRVQYWQPKTAGYDALDELNNTKENKQ